jgi:delta1-piperideine-2-carboxylate reductase
MTQTSTITIADLHQRVDAIFRKAGLNAQQAGALARVIVAGERDACKSHGDLSYRRGPAHREGRQGQAGCSAGTRPEPRFGHCQSRRQGGICQPRLRTRSSRTGRTRACPRSRGAGHQRLHAISPRLWPEVEAVTGRRPRRARHVPELCDRCAHRRQQAPARHQPLRLRLAAPDMPPLRLRLRHLVAARGEIELHRRAGKPLPEGWAIDADGSSRQPIRKRRWPAPCCPSAATRARRSAR